MTDHQFTILRVRPASAEPEGPRHDRLIELVQLLEPDLVLPEDTSGVSSETIPVALDASPFDEDLVRRISQSMKQHLSQRPILLVDFCYDRTIECYGFLEWLLYKSLLELIPELSEVNKLYILMDSLPRQGERLFLLTHDDGIGPGQCVFVDKRGELQGSSDLSSLDQEALDAWLTAVRADLPTLFDRRLLRKRGVFASSRKTTPETWYQFRYEITNPQGSRELSELLAAYFQEHSVTTVVFTESLAQAWMEPAVSFASHSVGASWSSLSSLEMSDNEIEVELQPIVRSVREELASEGAEVCMVLPAFRDGNGLLRLSRLAEDHGRTSFRTLAIIMDKTEADRHGATSRGWFRTAEIPVGATRRRVDYLLSAPIQPIVAGTWRSAAAHAAGPHALEDGLLGLEFAIWDLLDDYPIAEELPVPDGRDAIRWFPRLDDLDTWDATWVAWLLLDRLLNHLQCDRRELLIVMPNEENATGSVARALEQRLGVPVAALGRAVIDGHEHIGDREKHLIEDFRMLKVASIDESTIRGGTIQSMNKLIHAVRGRGADATCAMLRAGPSTLSVEPLFSWSPFLWRNAPNVT